MRETVALNGLSKKYYISNQKELKLNEHPDYTSLDKNLRKLVAVFYSIISFFL